jgi:hypothetical protein
MITQSYEPLLGKAQFVSDVHKKWKLNISPNSYQARIDGNSLVVTPKGAAAPHHVMVNGVDMLESPATFKVPPKSSVHAMDGGSLNWNQPQCEGRSYLYSRIDPTEVEAWADACYMTGVITYANQLGIDVALEEYQTCNAVDGDGITYNLTGCTMGFAPSTDGTDSELAWDDWSPKGTVVDSSCGNVTLSISVAGVGGSLAMNFCDELVPVKGANPLDFQANWQGSSPENQPQQTGDIIAVNNALYANFNFEFLWGGISLGYPGT